MDHDLLMMIYGGLIGASSSILTSFFASLFQSWLNRREYKRRQREEQDKRMQQIYLPTSEEIRDINSRHKIDRKKTISYVISPLAILFSIFACGAWIYQLHNPTLGLVLTAILVFLIMAVIRDIYS